MMIFTISNVWCSPTISPDITHQSTDIIITGQDGAIVYVAFVTIIILFAWFGFIICLLKKCIERDINDDQFQDMQLVMV